ncbi:MAG: protein-glutamate O-methyltransferase [bacterium]|nr:protein-glutamate O-methyltransferase [bacterium]
MLESIDAQLSKDHFKKLSNLMYNISGVEIQAGKEGLIQSRLTKRLRALQLPNFDSYLEYLGSKKGQEELLAMMDQLTTNKTHFFREKPHFDMLRNKIMPEIKATGSHKLRIWCAGCSSGEEPYTISMVLNESLPNIASWDIRILATDISPSMLDKARQRQYFKSTLMETPPAMIQKYFKKEGRGEQAQYQVKDNVAKLIHFAQLNLMTAWPMRGPFDVIFCRNVMIYFNQATRQQLVERYYKLLRPGGYLLIGHSESLTNQGRGEFNYIQPAAYQK